MSSRGAKTENGHVTTTEYKLKDGKMVEDAKVLVGTSSKQHGLPDYAHSPNSNTSKKILMEVLENLEIMMKQDFRLLKLDTILSNL